MIYTVLINVSTKLKITLWMFQHTKIWPALRGSSNSEYNIISISLLIITRWIKFASLYGTYIYIYVYIGVFILSICFLLVIFLSMFSIIMFQSMFSIIMFQSMFSIIHVSEYVFCFRVRFLFQSMFSIIHVSEYVLYYPCLKVCFLLSMFHSMFSIIHASEYVI